MSTLRSAANTPVFERVASSTVRLTSCYRVKVSFGNEVGRSLR